MSNRDEQAFMVRAIGVTLFVCGIVLGFLLGVMR
jgi:hypothetical protein